MARNVKRNQAPPQRPGAGGPGKKMSPRTITDIAL
jgi:hypothetical protein